MMQRHDPLINVQGIVGTDDPNVKVVRVDPVANLRNLHDVVSTSTRDVLAEYPDVPDDVAYRIMADLALRLPSAIAESGFAIVRIVKSRRA